MEPLDVLLEPHKTSRKRAVPTLKTLKNHWFSLAFREFAALGSPARLGSILEASWRRLGASWRRLGGVFERLGGVLKPLGASWSRLESDLARLWKR